MRLRTASGLVGHWKFNEKQGLVASDSSRYKNHGTITLGAGKWQERGLLFDGAATYVNAGTANLSTMASTLEMWVKSSVSQFKSMAGLKIGSGMLVYHGSSDGGNESAMFGFRGEHEIYSPTSSLSNNVYQHLVFVYDGNDDDLVTSYKIYINGVSQTLTRRVNLIGGTTTINFIGKEEATNYFNGTIDDVRIYNRAKSANEILRDYNTDKHNYI